MSDVAVSGAQWTIRSGAHEAVIVEVGGGPRTYTVDGEAVLDGYAADELCPGSAGQVLAPWPNRIRDGRYTFAGQAHQLAISEPARGTAIHGLVAWARWHLVDQAQDRVTIAHDLPATPGYPWSLRLTATYSLGPDGLRGDHGATNLAGSDAPFGFSIHPYIIIPGVPVDALTIHLPARNRVLVDNRLLPIGAARVAGTEFDFTEARPIGAARLDTAFGDVERDADGGSAVTLTAPDGRGRLLWADARFGWWQIYTGDTMVGDRVRRSVAIEPMTCPPDAFRSNKDVVVLEPGASWSGSWGITPSLRSHVS